MSLGENRIQWNIMPIAFFLLGCTLFVTKVCAAELSVCIGVLSCRCPISNIVILCGTDYLALMYIAPIAASAADVMTAFMIWAIFKTAPLLAGISALLDTKKFPPARLLAPSSLRY